MKLPEEGARVTLGNGSGSPANAEGTQEISQQTRSREQQYALGFQVGWVTRQGFCSREAYLSKRVEEIFSGPGSGCRKAHTHAHYISRNITQAFFPRTQQPGLLRNKQ